MLIILEGINGVGKTTQINLQKSRYQIQCYEKLTLEEVREKIRYYQ